MDDVKARGDEALFEYTKRFDGASLDGSSIRVTREEIDEAMKQVEPGLLEGHGEIHGQYPPLS